MFIVDIIIICPFNEIILYCSHWFYNNECILFSTHPPTSFPPTNENTYAITYVWFTKKKKKILPVTDFLSELGWGLFRTCLNMFLPSVINSLFSTSTIANSLIFLVLYTRSTTQLFLVFFIFFFCGTDCTFSFIIYSIVKQTKAQ